MATETTSLDTLTDIRKMMEKSSRFISLSGWSGIVAGACALAGAFFAHRTLAGAYENNQLDAANVEGVKTSLILIASAVFASAFLAAFLFTYFRSRRQGTPIWGAIAKRLLWNTMLPMAVGGLVILHLLSTENYSLIAPYTLIFYGLALINGSKYTLGEIRYLGYLEIILGLISLWFPDHWLLLWTIGFGAMHILYGLMMWWRYERK
ncbi:MAG TPA: hypothetical protein VK625_15710 [Flavitalea sp.]|nr:hypothetical protein [Flavitalea sp.]